MLKILWSLLILRNFNWKKYQKKKKKNAIFWYKFRNFELFIAPFSLLSQQSKKLLNNLRINNDFVVLPSKLVKSVFSKHEEIRLRLKLTRENVTVFRALNVPVLRASDVAFQTSEASAFTREMINPLFLFIGNHSCSFDVKKMQAERAGLRIMDLPQFSDVPSLAD